ncbi:hypothetical protein Pan216_21460 [Planctomycetes bacterium Pan216]|uniref:Uncharacterized protein n=1 Tax=Kolteria novifilia TaxID=2527975 RepID=A0A518B2S4_9BACT|nr:hypothetical protein Pan216_21460 [Planctomycetes bacterium Pan216]
MLKAYDDRLFGVLDVATSKEYGREVQKREAFKLNADGEEYEWVYDYGLNAYSRQVERFDRLDDKANSMLQSLGLGSLLTTVAGGVAAAQLSVSAGAAFLVPICALVLGIRSTIRSLEPRNTPYLPDVLEAKRYVEEDDRKDAPRAHLVFELHLLCVGTALASEEKAKLLKRATRWYFVAVVSLIIPLLVTLYVLWAKESSVNPLPSK